MSSRSWTRSLGAISAAGALVSGILIATTSPAPAGRPSPGSDWRACLGGSAARQATFALIWFGHRIAYVRAADVRLARG